MKKFIFLLVALGTIGLTSYFSLLPLNGNSQADISNSYFSSITPAGFTFGIWSLIYLSWLILGGVLLFRSEKQQYPLSFPLAVGLSALWLIPWHYEYIFVSVCIMAGIAYLLAQTFLHKRYFRLKQYSLELYFGWILVAFFVNIHTLLIAWDIYVFPVVFGAITLLCAFGIFFILLRYFDAFIPACVFIWALFGITQGQNILFLVILSYMLIIALIASIGFHYHKNISQFFLQK